MIDLHMHTNHSDGTDSVAELLKNAEKKQLEIISITDHDSIEAYHELDANPDLRSLYSGTLIVGTEMRALYHKRNIEVLGYGVDYKTLQISKMDSFQIQSHNLERLKEIAQNLGVHYEEEIHISKDDPKYFYGSHVFARSVLKFPENNRIFEEMGLPFEETAFYRVHESNPQSPFYLDNSAYFPSFESVVDAIHAAGGLAFLAHGYVYQFENPNEVIEEMLATTKIDGAECEYPLFSEEQRRDIKAICEKYGKYQSGGSDYHAANKPNIQLGSGINGNLAIPKSMIENWLPKVRTR